MPTPSGAPYPCPLAAGLPALPGRRGERLTRPVWDAPENSRGAEKPGTRDTQAPQGSAALQAVAPQAASLWAASPEPGEPLTVSSALLVWRLLTPSSAKCSKIIRANISSAGIVAVDSRRSIGQPVASSGGWVRVGPGAPPSQRPRVILHSAGGEPAARERPKQALLDLVYTNCGPAAQKQMWWGYPLLPFNGQSLCQSQGLELNPSSVTAGHQTLQASVSESMKWG